MRVLVYGAGVIGCELVHELCKGKNQVTLLARGKWKDTIEEDGMKIKHNAGFYTSEDYPNTISKLEPEDCYDIVFVVMQYNQIKDVLGDVARNISRHIVLVGNNTDAIGCEKFLHSNSVIKKEIAFGFQNSAGRREENQVVSVHIKIGMTIGGGSRPLSRTFCTILKETFIGTGYRLTKENEMDSWLKCHAAFILPICYVCYGLDGDLTQVTRKQMDEIFTAVTEAHEVLKSLGYTIRPDGEEEYFTSKKKKNERMCYMMAKTPLGRLLCSDHAMHAKEEMEAMDKDFKEMSMRSGIVMYTWEKLRKTIIN